LMARQTKLLRTVHLKSSDDFAGSHQSRSLARVDDSTPLMRSIHLEACMSNGLQLFGFATTRIQAVFPCPISVPVQPSLVTIATSSIFLANLLFRVPTPKSPPRSFNRRCSPWVSSLLATSPGVSTHHESCHALVTFRPQVFSTSRRFTPHSSSAGLFHPAAASREYLFRGFSLRAADLPRRKDDLPPCRWRTRYSATKVVGHIQRASTPRPCSVRSSVAVSAVIHPAEGSLPSSGSDSSRSYDALVPVTQDPPLMKLSIVLLVDPCRSARSPMEPSSAYRQHQLQPIVSDGQPARVFRAYLHQLLREKFPIPGGNGFQ